jgi:MoxR-like ATPase
MADAADTSANVHQDDLAAADELGNLTARLKAEVGTVIVGQDDVIEQLLISLFANSHCFMVGVPGLAKTLAVSTLAQVLQLSFKRIQFTPDLMPSDITGTDIIQEDPETGKRHFEFLKGPLFANLVLADEINRTPPKTQAALLEAMQERQVTAGVHTFKLEAPFFVLATQNPLEQEGTYPLPEAQLDRFMLNILVDYPEPEDELEVLKRTTIEENYSLTPILSGEKIIELQKVIQRVPVAQHVFEYALELVRKTRPSDELSPQFVEDWLECGAGPRAGQNLIRGAKARALMNGRYCVTCDDIEFLALPVLRHRLITNFNAEAEGIRTDTVIQRILEETPKHHEN